MNAHNLHRRIAVDQWLARREQRNRLRRAAEARHDNEVRDALARLDAERLRGQYITVALMVVGLLAAVATLLAGESATAAAFRAERVVVEAWNARTGGIPGSAA